MLSNIQNNVSMQKNQMAFKGKENFLSKVKRNILFSPEQQQRIRYIMQADITKEQKKTLLVNEAVSMPNIFTNIVGNLKRIFARIAK